MPRLETFSHVVSLGMRCATTHNTRRFFNCGEEYPFDWWLTPFGGLLQVLQRPEIDWLYDPDLLRVNEKLAAVAHAQTRIVYHHEFRRDPGKVLRPDFLQRLERPRARTEMLLAKLWALDEPGNRILFVREVGNYEPLVAALAARFSRADWRLTVIPQKIDNAPDYPTAATDRPWLGDPVLWDKALSLLDVRLDNPDLKPFTGSQPEWESKRMPLNFAADLTP